MKDEAITPEFSHMMNDVAKSLDGFFNGSHEERRVGFVLLTFNFGDPEGRVNYISNTKERQEMIAMMKSYIQRAEATKQ